MQSIVLDDVTVVPSAPPHTYLGVANSMIRGVEILAQASPTSPLSLALVASHALECTLKAYLSRDGADARLRRSELRHNLTALWMLAQQEGLAVSAQPPQWVETLGHIHNSPYYLRYSTAIHALSTPRSEPMFSELQALLVLVRQAIA